MDGQNQNRDTSSGHNELSHDEAVSLRASATPSGAVTASQPNSRQQPVEPPVPAPAGGRFTETPRPSAQQYDAEPLPDAGPLSRAPYALENERPVNYAANTTTDEPVDEGEVEVSWTASEFIAHEKTPTWYGVLAIVAIVGAALAYLISRDWVAVAAILVCAGMFGYVAARAPRQLEFVITTTGVGIGPKFYPFKKFRSYSVVDEGAFASIDFMPLKRFDMPISVYYDPEHEDKIMQILSQHLAIDQHKRTMLDGLMHRIRF